MRRAASLYFTCPLARQQALDVGGSRCMQAGAGVDGRADTRAALRRRGGGHDDVDGDPPGGAGPSSSSSSSSSATLLASAGMERARLLYPQSKAQERFTGRVEDALANVLAADHHLRSGLVEAHGFAVRGVRVSRDRQYVTVLWDSSPLGADACRRSLQRLQGRLRAQLGTALKTRAVPALDFRRNDLQPGQASSAMAMVKALEELQAEQVKRGGSEGEADGVVQQAVQALQAGVRPKQWWRKAAPPQQGE